MNSNCKIKIDMLENSKKGKRLDKLRMHFQTFIIDRDIKFYTHIIIYIGISISTDNKGQ